MKRALLIAGAIAALAGCSQKSTDGVPVVVTHTLYVSNPGATTPAAANTLSMYPASATGNAAPTQMLGGSSTGLNNPFGLAVDGSGQLYVGNAPLPGTSSITVYAPGATGNAPPGRTISGAATHLTGPYLLALDAARTIYATNNSILTGGPDSITAFSGSANGNVAPTEYITGAATQLGTPCGIAIDAAGEIVVANSGSNTITVYAAGATGNVAPIRTIAGAATTLAQPTGLAIDAQNRIWVTTGTATVAAFAAGANGNVAPIYTLTGANTLLNFPIGIAFDFAGDLDVANNPNVGADSVLVFNGLGASTLPASGNLAPNQNLTGVATLLAGPFSAVTN